MTTWLLDGSLLAALALSGIEAHGRARAWFARRVRRFATCPITQGTLLRLHMQLASDRSVEAAWETLRRIEANPRHEFWPDGLSYTEVPNRHLQGHKQVTDAWLAQLARRRGGRLATLDSALATLHRDVAVLIPLAEDAG